jgi:hypothetical protein
MKYLGIENFCSVRAVVSDVLHISRQEDVHFQTIEAAHRM